MFIYTVGWARAAAANLEECNCAKGGEKEGNFGRPRDGMQAKGAILPTGTLAGLRSLFCYFIRWSEEELELID